MKTLVIMLIVLAGPAHSSGNESRSKIGSNGDTKITAQFGRMLIGAVFSTSTVDIGSPSQNAIKRRFVQCTYSTFPCVLTGQLKFFINGVEVIVPPSAYADLGDISTAEISKSGDLFVLTI